MNRELDFTSIKQSLCGFIRGETSRALVGQGDSLELMKRLPDHCVSLIFTDPPYHATKKRNIQGDTSFKEDGEYLAWMGEYASEWYRVLRPNGSLFCFCAPSLAARLEVLISEKFNVLSQIVWTKPNDPGFDGWKQKMKKTALRQWYAHSERIIFAEPSFEGNLHRSYFGNVLREKRRLAGLSGHQLTERIGAYGRINHGGAVSNWEAGRNVPSIGQYESLCKALLKTGKVTEMPAYRDLIRPFNVEAWQHFTDVWDFPSVRPFKGKHPAEKPLALVEHAIKATTYPDDIVLDCFSGSGSAIVAAAKLGRFGAALEIDPKWVARTVKELGSEHRRNVTPVSQRRSALNKTTGQHVLFTD
jgi:adenine-specific DNA-methyltransferase